MGTINKFVGAHIVGEWIGATLICSQKVRSQSELL